MYIFLSWFQVRKREILRYQQELKFMPARQLTSLVLVIDLVICLTLFIHLCLSYICIHKVLACFVLFKCFMSL